MTLLDDLRALRTKAEDVIENTDLREIVKGVLDSIERVISEVAAASAHPASAPGSDSTGADAPPTPAPSETPASDEPPTEGSQVFDAAPGGPDAEPPSPAEPAADVPDEAEQAADAEAAQAASDEPPTEGSAVFDAHAAAQAQVEASFPGTAYAPMSDEAADAALGAFTIEQLHDELARRQQAAIVKADAEKSVLGPLEPIADPEGHA